MAVHASSSTGTDVVGRRVGAYLVDWLVLTVITLFVVRAWYVDNAVEVLECTGQFGPCVGTGTYVLDDAASQEYRIRIGAVAALWLLNHVVFQGLTGATVGKILVGIRTVEDKGYRRPGIVRCFFRSLLLPLDVLIGWLVSMLPSRTNQRLGDRLAGTRVVSLSWYGIPPDATRLPRSGRLTSLAAPGGSPSAMPVPGATHPVGEVPPSAHLPSRPPGFGPAPPARTDPFAIPEPPPSPRPEEAGEA